MTDNFDDIPDRAVAEERIIQEEVAADWRADIISEADQGEVLITALQAGDWRTTPCDCSCHKSLGGVEVSHAVACCGYIPTGGLNLAEEFQAQGRSYVELDDDGNVVTRKPPDYK